MEFSGQCSSRFSCRLALVDDQELIQQWQRLQAQIAALQILREMMHSTIVKVGRQAVLSRTGTEETDKILE